MDRLRAMQAFVKVAESGSFVRAAELLGVSKATISLLVSDLESALGTRLMQRTTRKLSLTEAGLGYLACCQDILESVAQAEAMLSANQSEVRGVLRAYAPLAFAQHHIVPMLPAYRQAHPEVTIDLVLGTRAVDLVEEGFDLAILFAQQGLPSTLVARRLAYSDIILCASQAYLDQAGMPSQPEELASHAILIPQSVLSQKLEHAQHGSVSLSWPTPALVCNATEALRASALAGMGIAVLPSYVVSESLRMGELVEVLPGWRAGRLDLCLAYASRRYLSSKVRSAADFIVARFAEFVGSAKGDPWLAGAREADPTLRI